MQTTTTYQYLGTDMIMSGVYDWLAKTDSGLMAALNVTEVHDNGVKYNVDTRYPNASWLDTDDIIPEDAGTFEQRSAAVYTLLGQINIDKRRIATTRNQNVEAVEMMRKMRGFLDEWQEKLLWGQTTTGTGTKQCKGLLRLLAEIETESTTDLDGGGDNSQVIIGAAESAAFTIPKMEELEDAVRLGVDAYVMTRKARRYLNALARASGILFTQETDEWNHKIQVFNGGKIYINDHMDNNLADGASSALDIATIARSTTASASGTDNTIILAMNLGTDGVRILQTGDIVKEPRFQHPKKDAWVHNVKWYTGFACYHKYALAGLVNIKPEA